MRNKISFVCFIAAMFFICSCRLTRTDVIGKWKVSTNDTLHIFPDNTFTLNKSGALGIGGTWRIDKKKLSFNFSDTLQHFGGNCKSYQYMWTKGSKKSLVRPVSCLYPTNHFNRITKIE